MRAAFVRWVASHRRRPRPPLTVDEAIEVLWAHSAPLWEAEVTGR